MKLYLRLLSYVKPYWPRFVTAIICIILAACGNLFIPWIIKDVIDIVLANKDKVTLNIITVLILLVVMLRGVFFFGQTYLMSYIGQRVVIDIREAVYRHFQCLSLSYFEKRRTGAVMSYITNDVAAVQSAIVTTVVEMITETMVLIGSIAAMFYIHWELSLLTFITIPPIAAVINIFGNKLKNAGRVIQERAADITSILQETLSSVRIIKSFVREE
jgi:subfamily B ATP-binding cassette protein MsbA